MNRALLQHHSPRIIIPVATLILFMLVTRINLAGSEEFYVYEIVHESAISSPSQGNKLQERVSLKLSRVSGDAFKVEILHIEPEYLRTSIETLLNLSNWIVELTSVSGTQYRVLIIPGVGPEFPLYVDPGLIEMGCEKYGEVEKTVVKAFIDPNTPQEERFRYIRQIANATIEVQAISLLVGDIQFKAGLQGLPIGVINADYKLSAICRGSVKFFSYKFATNYGHLEAQSSYSSTGWLMNAKFTGERALNYYNVTRTIEVKLIETTNQELKTHASSEHAGALQTLKEFVANPQVLALIVVIATLTLSLVIVKTRR